MMLLILNILYTDPPGVPGKPVAEAVDDSIIGLSWSPPLQSIVKSYVIEKSDDEGRKWDEIEKVRKNS